MPDASQCGLVGAISELKPVGSAKFMGRGDHGGYRCRTNVVSISGTLEVNGNAGAVTSPRVDPLCCICLEAGRVTPATVADQIESPRSNYELFRLGKLRSCVLSVSLDSANQ